MSKLDAWNDSLSEDLLKHLQKKISRRKFLAGMLMTGAAASAMPSLVLSAPKYSTQKEPWTTILIVEDHLFPADGNGPSARDINSIAYLQAVMSLDDMDKEEYKFIHQGVGWLNDLAKETHHHAFVALQYQQREQLLHKIATTQAGENWLSVLLFYIFEALLADPVYGGNPDGIGWRWLEHQPGFPRPSESKRYYKL